MLRYTLKRILTGVLSLFVLATVTFFLVRLIPGSPFQRGGVSTQVVEAVEEEYGLNEPLFEQYVTYMGSLLRGDLGISYQDPGTEVAEIIGRAWPPRPVHRFRPARRCRRCVLRRPTGTEGRGCETTPAPAKRRR